MLILGFDTSLSACSAAILQDDNAVWVRSIALTRGHAEVLPLMIADGLAHSGLRITELDRIGVTTGPGAFAGVRVGLAFARGLCLGASANAVGVNSLLATAASAARHPDSLLAPIIDARRGEVYASLLTSEFDEILGPFAAKPEDARRRIQDASEGKPVRFVGDAAALEEAIDDKHNGIDPVAVARLAADGRHSQSPAAPVYLRPPDAAVGNRSLFAVRRE